MRAGRLFGHLSCPSCGSHLDGYTGVREDATPSDGDFSICAYCREVNVYQSHPLVGWTLRAATPFEAAECREQLRKFGEGL